ncbi:MAG: GTP 3',8-cyclase MoaA [Akkermansiaceae bacterium]
MQRPLRDLRISVTDRCNFRCRYCMPAEVFGEDYPFLPKPEILSFEEIARLARVFCGLGVQKIRLTGGEPLLRRDLHELIAMLAEIPGGRDLALTTNGTTLARHAQGLKNAGLGRVTISLDALDPHVFARMHGTSVSPDQVIEGVDAALACGLGVKINSVIQRNVNEEQIVELARFARQRRVTLRLIEYMDTGNTNGWRADEVVGFEEMLACLKQHYSVKEVAPDYPGETARRFRYTDDPDLEIGFITSVTKPFCGDCNRARLSADGQLFTCLFSATGHDIKSMLRAGVDDEALAANITSIWSQRGDRYSELRQQSDSDQPKPEMSYLGG